MPRLRALCMGLVLLVLLSCRATSPPRAQIVIVVAVPDPGLDENAPAPPPFALTSTDGTGLRIESVSAETSIEDPLALTQLHLTFENPEQRTLEGRFTFLLPEGAALSRFAMRINGAWQEGEVVEKQQARITYEEFLHRRVDPALLEQGAGNEFAVRVFPIAARDKKEFLITYSETLQRGTPYRLRLAGLPRTGRLAVRVHAGGELLAELDERGKVRRSDLVVPSARWSKGESIGLRAGSSLVARVALPLGDASAARFEREIVLFDTSASRVLDLGREIAALRAFVRQLPPATPLRIACFDQSVVQVFEGAASSFDETVVERIRARRALGASDIAAGLRWAAASAKSAARARHRLVLFSDGVATAGETSPQALAILADALAGAGVVRADAVAIGGLRDEATLRAIVKAALPEAGVVAAVDAGHDSIARKLSTKTLPRMEIAVRGAKWSYPTSVEAQPGDEIAIHAEVEGQRAIQITIGEHTFEPSITNGTGPLVERAVAMARIRAAEEGPDTSEDARRAIIDLSRRHRIVSRDTSMLVLETEADFERFKIDRDAKLNVLAVADGLVTVLHQKRGFGAAGVTSTPEATPAPRPPTPDPSATASASTPLTDAPAPQRPAAANRSSATGHGSISRGRDHSAARIAAKHVSKPPQVRMGATSVSGRVPPEIIQRIVRQNFGRFRGCYEQGLRRHPTLAGRISVRFVITRDGSVSQSAEDPSSTLADASVRSCVVRAFQTLTFPALAGSNISVTYPINFLPEGSTEPPAAPLPISPSTMARRRWMTERGHAPEPTEPVITPDPYEGHFATVMNHIADGESLEAMTEAWKWRAAAPSELLSFVALGEAAEAMGDRQLAARAYGSILELWSYRADMRRFAGERLERVGTASALALASDAYAGAVEDRPDHPSGYRLHAMALVKQGKREQAFDVLETALQRDYAVGRFAGARMILGQDLAIVARSWAAAEPGEREGIDARLERLDLSIDDKPSVRFVLVWETDVSDVDLHVVDAKGNHASHFGRTFLRSGGELTANVTNGYGPESFVVRGADSELAFPYKLRVHNSWRGTSGYGMGKVQVVRHDGKGGLQFEERPFVLMRNGVMADLGVVEATPSKLAISR